MRCVAKPDLVISAPDALFSSFFTSAHQRRLARAFQWRKISGSVLTLALRRGLADAQAMITTWDSTRFGDELLAIAPKLRVIAHCGGEVKSRFQASLLETLTITTAPEPMARATAELAATLLLYCCRNVDFYRGKLRKPSNRIYDDVHSNGTPESLIGGEVGMIGFGRIGRTLVDLMRGFDLGWRVYDPYASSELAKTYPVKFVTLQSLLKGSRLLVLTAALTEETRGMLSPANLAQLPDGACVINVARGGLLDLEALTREVRNGRLRCAIDVTDPNEPMRPNHPLRRLPGAIVTPHIGGGAVKARHEMAHDLIDDLERFFRGRPVKHRVTTAMLARMT